MKNTCQFRKNFVFENCLTCKMSGAEKVICDSVPEIFESRIDVLFLGVNPGREEARESLPFVGPSGKLLRKMAGEILTKKTFAFSNVILCSTSNESCIADKEEITAHCRANVRKICAFFNPKIYVPCGNTAMRAVGIAENTITKNAGKVFLKNNATIIPILHPSSILRGFADRKTLYEQIANIYFELKKKNHAKA